MFEGNRGLLLGIVLAIAFLGLLDLAGVDWLIFGSEM